MNKGIISFAAATLAMLSVQVLPAEAQANQRIARALPPVQSTINMGVRMIPARRANQGGMRNGLPPTNMDSFVYESGAKAWHIYGDEGVYSIPPFMEFSKEHRIEAGINGRRRRGLTTGHGSHLPDAWGGDEFVDGPEWSDSGAGGTRSQYQPFEAVQESPVSDVYRTPPFINEEFAKKTVADSIEQMPKQHNLKNTVQEMAQDSQQALFGRQLGRRTPPTQQSAFNWP